MDTPAVSPYQSASLYVGDLDPTVTESLLFEIFKAVGTVASIRVCRDAITRHSLGYAYVNFTNYVDAERALDTLNYTPIKGRHCRIMWSHRDPSLRKSGQGNVFIKNLDKGIDNQALYDTFSAFGNILSCKVVTDSKGNSKGYGFVHYESKEAADQAIAKVHGMLLNGKIVYVGPFIPKKERIPGSDPDRYTNLYIKNLDTSYSDEDLRRDFESFGPIQSAVLMKNQKGSVAFVNFENHEDAKKASDALNGKRLGGSEKEVYVARAQKKSERDSMLKKLRDERAQKYQGINLYVKNLDDSVNDVKLQEAFVPYGDISSCKVMVDEKGNSRGFGFVCFSKADEASRAITEMNGSMLEGKPIYVALAERKELRRAKLAAQHAARRGTNPALGAPVAYPMGGAPTVFFPPPQAGPQGQAQPFVYPGQGMPVNVGPRRWAGPGPAGQRGQAFQMPNFVVHRGPRGAAQPVHPAQQGNMNRNFKYTQNARNQKAPTAAGQPAGGPAGPLPTATGAVPATKTPVDATGQAPLSATALAAASTEERREIIGERLYPLIEEVEPTHGPKITGMLLDSMEVSELLHLLESPQALREKIDEALAVLKAHNAGQ